MAKKKISILAMKEILEQYSDEEHILTQKNIIHKIANKYGIVLDRRTLYSNIAMLKDSGIHISDFKDNGVGYRIDTRIFSRAEAILLCHAIHSSNFISQADSKRMTEEILNTQSEYFQEEFKQMGFGENARKKNTSELLANLETIYDCVRSGVKMSFSYQRYTMDKKVVNRRKEPYVVSPYYVVFEKDRGYLIAKTENHEDHFTHYRIDRMSNIHKLPENEVCKLLKHENPYDYANNKLYMFGGDEMEVTVRCDKSILDAVIDNFGKNVAISPVTTDSFDATFKSTEKGALLFVQQYFTEMKIMKPASLKKKFIESLQEAQAKYKK